VPQPQITVLDDYEMLSRAGAELVADALAERPNTRVVVATGATPMGLYRELVRKREDGDLDASNVTVFQLDEYIGVAPDDRRSLLRWAMRSFVEPLDIPASNVVPLPVDGDPAACAVYDRDVAEAGGYDLAILGIGMNGHIGFNEPPSDATVPTRMVELAPESAVLQHVLGFVLYFAGRAEEANAPIQRALEIDPNFTGAFRTLALAQTAVGKGAEAVELLQRALRQAPSDADAILQLSLLHIEQKQFAEALAVLEPYIKQSPDDVRALNNQGLALRGLKRFEEARRALKRASRLSTDDPLVLTNLGCVLVDLDRAAEARSLHEHALRSLPGDSRLLGHYGICLAALGANDKAREALDAALAANPNNAEALDALVKLGA